MAVRDTIRTVASRQKTLPAPRLNRLGLQLARTAAAQAVHRRRRWPADPSVAEAVARLRADGLVVVPGLLGSDEVARLREVAERVTADPDLPHDRLAQGANALTVTWRRDLPPADREVLDRFFLHPTLVALAEAAERVPVEPGSGHCTVQLLEQRDGEGDLEAQIHSDTFHPTHKAWLYLTDVGPEDGPLTYYPRSHRLGRHSAAGVYRESCGPNAGSRRIEERELRAHGVDPEVVTCGAGTLVVADTFGYHGRLQGSPPGRRLVLTVELRNDPFRPHPHRAAPVDRS